MTRSSDGRQAYWEERLREHWGPEGVGSLVYGREFNRWRYRVRTRVFRRLIRRLALATPELDVLDVGSGTGFYLGEWHALGVRSLAGLDLSEWAVAQLARAYPTATLYRADIGREPALPVAVFDVITAFDVLCHLVDDERHLSALRTLHRALKPGGWLLFSDSFFHGASRQHEDYWKGRSLASLSATLEGCGFRIIDRVPMSVLMAAPTDTRHGGRNERIWNAAMSPVRWGEPIGWLMGAALYPLELLLTAWLRESPAIEIMVCRKAGAAA
ncbi:MAG TPA: class I SAM-dependent methyltransferase [Thermoanaerobaculaceae bacterium]|nr:class I SAM-dependent methyltransferase [Thermoanaerobaculaceae bacterium]